MDALHLLIHALTIVNLLEKEKPDMTFEYCLDMWPPSLPCVTSEPPILTRNWNLRDRLLSFVIVIRLKSYQDRCKEENL